MTEIGGQFVGPTQDRILALAKKVGVNTYQAAVPGERVYVHEGKAKRFSGLMPPDLFALPDMGIADQHLPALRVRRRGARRIGPVQPLVRVHLR